MRGSDMRYESVLMQDPMGSDGRGPIGVILCHRTLMGGDHVAFVAGMHMVYGPSCVMTESKWENAQGDESVRGTMPTEPHCCARLILYRQTDLRGCRAWHEDTGSYTGTADRDLWNMGGMKVVTH